MRCILAVALLALCAASALAARSGGAAHYIVPDYDSGSGATTIVSVASDDFNKDSPCNVRSACHTCAERIECGWCQLRQECIELNSEHGCEEVHETRDRCSNHTQETKEYLQQQRKQELRDALAHLEDLENELQQKGWMPSDDFNTQYTAALQEVRREQAGMTADDLKDNEDEAIQTSKDGARDAVEEEEEDEEREREEKEEEEKRVEVEQEMEKEESSQSSELSEDSREENAKVEEMDGKIAQVRNLTEQVEEQLEELRQRREQHARDLQAVRDAIAKQRAVAERVRSAADGEKKDAETRARETQQQILRTKVSVDTELREQDGRERQLDMMEDKARELEGRLDSIVLTGVAAGDAKAEQLEVEEKLLKLEQDEEKQGEERLEAEEHDESSVEETLKKYQDQIDQEERELKQEEDEEQADRARRQADIEREHAAEKALADREQQAEGEAALTQSVKEQLEQDEEALEKITVTVRRDQLSPQNSTLLEDEELQRALEEKETSDERLEQDDERKLDAELEAIKTAEDEIEKDKEVERRDAFSIEEVKSRVSHSSSKLAQLRLDEQDEAAQLSSKKSQEQSARDAAQRLADKVRRQRELVDDIAKQVNASRPSSSSSSSSSSSYGSKSADAQEKLRGLLTKLAGVH